MPVDQIWLSACPQRRIVRRVVQSALVRGTTVVRVAPSGPLAWGDAQLEVLWPPRAQACSLEENDRSLVLSLRTPGGRALFMGDAGRSVERALLMTRGASLAAEVLKVGHHGSAGGSSAVFLQAVGASIGLVSAPGDRPGALPSRAALRRLDDAKVRRWITGVEGTIEVTLSAGSRPRVQTLRTP